VAKLGVISDDEKHWIEGLSGDEIDERKGSERS
jgi:hypothetical protein